MPGRRGDQLDELEVVLDRELEALLVRDGPEDVGRDGAAHVDVQVDEVASHGGMYAQCRPGVQLPAEQHVDGARASVLRTCGGERQHHVPDALLAQPHPQPLSLSTGIWSLEFNPRPWTMSTQRLLGAAAVREEALHGVPGLRLRHAVQVQPALDGEVAPAQRAQQVAVDAGAGALDVLVASR